MNEPLLILFGSSYVMWMVAHLMGIDYDEEEALFEEWYERGNMLGITYLLKVVTVTVLLPLLDLGVFFVAMLKGAREVWGWLWSRPSDTQ